MSWTTVISLEKENFKFSSGHFTIFSATERENLHGHNFQLGVDLECEVVENGMTFDYGLAKREAERLCRELNERMLLPAHSPFLRIETLDGQVRAHFNGEAIPFLPRDVRILPVDNVTVEELARFFLRRFVEGFAADPGNRILAVTTRIASGPGQSASATWRRSGS